MNTPALLSSSRRLLDPDACRREDDVRLVAEAWLELLGQEPTDRVRAYFYTSPGCEDMPPRVVHTVGTPERLGGFGAVDHMYETAWACRLAADLIRACAEVDAAATPEMP